MERRLLFFLQRQWVKVEGEFEMLSLLKNPPVNLPDLLWKNVLAKKVAREPESAEGAAGAQRDGAASCCSERNPQRAEA